MRIRCGACLILSTLTIFPLILLISPDLFNEIINGQLVHALIPKEFLGNSDITLDENIAPAGNAGRAPGVKQNTTLLLQKDDFDHDVLIYNRAPKCASIWLTRLLYLLGAGNMNQFTVQSPWEEGEKPFLTADGQRSVVKAIENTDNIENLKLNSHCSRNLVRCFPAGSLVFKNHDRKIRPRSSTSRPLLKITIFEKWSERFSKRSI